MDNKSIIDKQNRIFSINIVIFYVFVYYYLEEENIYIYNELKKIILLVLYIDKIKVSEIITM